MSIWPLLLLTHATTLLKHKLFHVLHTSTIFLLVFSLYPELDHVVNGAMHRVTGPDLRA